MVFGARVDGGFFLKGNQRPTTDESTTGDGKEMMLDTEKLGIKDVMEEVDRHSRVLNRKAELTGN